MQQRLLQTDAVRMVIPPQPPVNGQGHAAHGIKSTARLFIAFRNSAGELPRHVAQPVVRQRKLPGAERPGRHAQQTAALQRGRRRAHDRRR